LDLNRLIDRNDDYDELLADPEKKQIVLRNGEYVLAVPYPEESVSETIQEESKADLEMA